MSGKYAPLTAALNALAPSSESVTFSFQEIEAILGFALPRSACNYRPWWENPGNAENHTQARGWMDAGFRVESVDLRNRWVEFTRSTDPYGRPETDRAGGDPPPKAGPVASQPTPVVRAWPGSPSNVVAGNKRVVLISCAAKKLRQAARAQDLYMSPLFRRQLAYARKLAPDSIFILSAKYGLVDLDEVIEPYDLTLKDLGSRDRQAWAGRVLAQLQRKADLSADRFIVLAGVPYRQFLTPALGHWEAPLKGLTIGRQLQKLDKLLGE